MKHKLLSKIIFSLFITSALWGCMPKSKQRSLIDEKARENTQITSKEKGSKEKAKKTVTESIPKEKINEPNIINNIPVYQIFKSLQDGVFMVFAQGGEGVGSQGSGFFIRDDGVGITNYHVLSGKDEYKIKTVDGRVFEISEILETSVPDENDYVIFKINNFSNSTFTSLPIADQRIEIGEDIIAIGSPFGLENSLTRGSVSQYRENNRIQIDATIDHGSSGGPLINMRGEVIGITTSGISGSGLNFAVNIQVLPYEKYLK